MRLAILAPSLLVIAHGCRTQTPINAEGDSILAADKVDLDVTDNLHVENDFCPQADGMNLKNAVFLSSLALASYGSEFRLRPYAKSLGFHSPQDQKKAARASLIIAAIQDYYNYKASLFIETQSLAAHSIWEHLATLSHRENLQPTLVQLFDGDETAARHSLEFAYLKWTAMETVHEDNLELRKAKAPEEIKTLLYDYERNFSDNIGTYWSRATRGNFLALFAGWIRPLTDGQCNFLRADNQVAWLENDSSVIIIIRGTEAERESKDIQTDLAAVQAPIDAANENYAHTGFLCASDDIWGNFLQRRIRTVVKNSPKKPVFITGHSLGGALATILSYRMLTDASTAAVNLKGIYSYGSPRVGNQGFKNALERLAAKKGTALVRIRNGDDTVSMIPADIKGVSAFPYQHVGTFVHLRDDVFGSYLFDQELQRGKFANTYGPGKTPIEPTLTVYGEGPESQPNRGAWLQYRQGGDIKHYLSLARDKFLDALTQGIKGIPAHGGQNYHGRLQWTLDAWRQKNHLSPNQECQDLTAKVGYFRTDVPLR